MRRRMRLDFALISWLALIASAAMLTAAVRGAFVRATPAEMAVADSAAEAVLGGEVAPARAVPGRLAGDPFSISRRRPADGTGRSQRPAATDSAPATEGLRLLGTIIRPDSSFIICQLGSEPARLMKIGEHVGELVLVGVEQGRAIFATQRGVRVGLTLSTPGT